jgi:hypothetical protein
MVSFWPFGGDENSAASFEKALSQLSDKITTATARNARFKHRQRKYKALWTIYTVFGYILIDIILIIVTRWENWGPLSWTLVSGGPLGIYIVRRILHAYYDSRLAAGQEHLNELVKQRDETLEKLKATTKYDSTQILLEKYGGSPSSKRSESSNHLQRKRQKSDNGAAIHKAPTNQQPARTGMPPPATANIQASPVLRQPQDSARPVSWAGGPNTPSQQPGLPSASAPGEEFAPNAFASPARPPMVSVPSQYANSGPKWYDRIMDVILGDDETQAKNRLVLICSNCRLVNGQAPPGARTEEDIGKWRCSECKTLNGVESEEKRVLKHAAQRELEPQPPRRAATDLGTATRPLGEDFEHVSEEIDSDEDQEIGADGDTKGDDGAPPAKSTRSAARSKRRT